MKTRLEKKKEIFEVLDLLMALHVLLAAETFSTDVAMVESGGVASLGIQHLIMLPTKKIILPRECEGSKVLKTNGRTSGNRRIQPSVEPKNVDISEMLCFRQSLLLLSFTF